MIDIEWSCISMGLLLDLERCADMYYEETCCTKTKDRIC